MTAFRETPIGPLPIDWSLETLGDLFAVSAGGDWDPDNCVRVRDARHPYPVVANAMGDETSQGFCSYFTVQGDTLTITGRGDVGHAVYRPEPYVPIVRLLALVPKRDLSSRFYSEYINCRVKFSLESTGVPQLTAPQVRPYLLALPPPEEQRAIADALRETDDLIATLERVIAKKRAIKHGMLQQLLTGRIRLPGFAGRWVEIQAGEIGTFNGGSGFPVRYQGASSGEFPFYKVSDMNNVGNELFMTTANNYISPAQRKAMGAVVMPTGAIVFAKVGAAVFLERKRVLTRPSCIDNNMAAFILDGSRADVRFVHYALTKFPLASLVATGALPSLNGRQLRSIPLNIPSDLGEQIAIAETLGDVDDEIYALDARLTKARAIKTGMMQELLTGRVRLPLEAAP